METQRQDGGLTEQQKRELKQHYFWMGLTAKHLKPYLTLDEADLLRQFSKLFATRMGIYIGDRDGAWPSDNLGQWEALK